MEVRSDGPAEAVAAEPATLQVVSAAGPAPVEGPPAAGAARLLPLGGSLGHLDRLAGLAARLLGTPAAQVSLITDVRTTVGGHGLPDGVVGASEPLTNTLCATPASTGTPLAISDTRADPRSRDLPLVAGGVVGAYLGVPLTDSAGGVVGTVCVLDAGPRAWAANDVALLTEVATSAVAELELAALAADYETNRVLLDLTVQAAGIGTFDLDLVTGATVWDDRMHALFGVDPTTHQGDLDAAYDLIHPDDLAAVQADVAAAVDARGAYASVYRVLLPGGGVRWVEARGRVLLDPAGVPVRLLGAAHDATDRHLVAAAEAAASARAALLARVTDELTGAADPEEAVARLAQAVVPVLADWCVVTLLDGDRGGSRRGLRDVGWWHVDPAALPVVEAYSRLRLDALTDASFLLRSLDRGEVIAVERHATAALRSAVRPGAARDLLLELAPSSFVVLPLLADGRTVGGLTLFSGAGRPAASTDEVATAVAVAGRAGTALDAARRYRQQRDLASGLQRSLLTPPPEPDHAQVVVRYAPAAAAAQVGGDWYDSFLQADGSTVLVIGDVIGHDTVAAAAMSQVRTLLRGTAALTGAGPAAALRQVDEVMRTLGVETSATAIVARLEQAPDQHERGTTSLRWSSAGHPPPMVVHPAGGVEVLEAESDLLLGLDATTPRHERVVELERGATVLLYTDGLVERRGASLDDGLERLQALLGELTAADGWTLDDLCDGLLARMLPGAQEDDVALVAVRLHRQDRPRPAEAGPNRLPPGVSRDEP